MESEVLIQFANDAFYQLIHYSEIELEQKNGMRLSALLPVPEFLEIQKFVQGESESCIVELSFKGKQRRRNFAIASLQKIEDGQTKTIFMQCFGINGYKQKERNLNDVLMMVDYLLENKSTGLLLFDCDGGTIRYCQTHSFLVQRQCVNEKFPDIFLENSRIHPDDIKVVKNCADFIKNAKIGNQQLMEIRILNQKNEYVWIQVDLSIQEFRNHLEGVAILTDIHMQKITTQEYVEQAQFYQSMLDSKDAYGHFDITSDQFSRMGGLWNLYNEVKETMSYTELFRSFIEIIVHPDDRKHYVEVMERQNLEDSFDNGITNLGCEFRRIVDQNKMTWMEISIHLFKSTITQHLMALMYIKNIDNKHKAKQAINEEHYDDLTKLFSHNTLIMHINSYLESIQSTEISAFIYCNINNMKQINATYGYRGGDSVLISLSNVLSSVFRKRDIIGRYSNDRFIILLKDVPSSGFEARIQSLLHKVEEYKEKAYTISLGIVYATKGDTFINCYKQASIAMMNIKGNTKSSYEIYTDDILSNTTNEGFHQEIDRVMEQASQLEANIQAVNDSAFDSIVGNHGDIAYLVDPNNYELLIGNQALYERLGLSIEECKGRTCYDLLHKRQNPCPFCQKSNWASDKFFMYRTYNQNLEQEFLIKNKLVSWKGNMSLLAFAIDLSNDKSVVDSMQNDMSEETYILEGVQNMQRVSSLDNVMQTALETICIYFRADAVRFWDFERKGEAPRWEFFGQSKTQEQLTYDMIEIQNITKWLMNRQWKDYIIIENPEVMLTSSLELSSTMKKKGVNNQRWLCMYDNKTLLGIIEIDSIRANFQNLSFLKSFTSFVAQEWHKCQILDDMLYNLNYDTLTGVYNRKKYDEFIASYDPDKVISIAVIVIDIDGLSRINSLKGSKVGDSSLQTLALTMREIFSEAMNYRLGGDEFQVIWEEVNQTLLEKRVQQFIKAVEEIDDFSISIGYSWDSIEKKISTMVEFATKSMLLNKSNKQSNVDKIKNIDHFKMQDELISSLANGEYVIYIQPKVNAKYGNVVGGEALIRRIAKDGSIIPPSAYISKFEKNGLIRYIDLFVFEKVCELIKKWQSQKKQCPVISLNFSRLTMMEQNLIEIMNAIIEKNDIEKKYVEIEITESYADVGKTMLYQVAKAIHEAGFSVSLDDFGTDFTNLSILSDIHVDVLKIDKSLIHSMRIHEKNRTILKYIIDMCNDLGITVIAEGVENMEQRNTLIELGCNLIQGYLFSRPIDVETFERAFLPRVSNR